MIFDKLKEMVASELNVDASKVTMESNFVDDLGADSLDAIELVMAVEDEFGISIEDDETQSIHTVADIVKLIEEKTK